MTTRSSRQFVVDGNTVSAKDFFDNYTYWNSKLKSRIKESVYKKKQDEGELHYKWRMFNYLYRKFKSNSEAVISKNAPSTEESLLDSIGFSIVKKCPKVSRINSKSTGTEYKIKSSDLESLVESLKKEHTINKRHKINISFGVEFEFIGFPSQKKEFMNEMIALVGSNRFFDEGGYCKNDGQKWLLGKDSTVKPIGDDRMSYSGYELTSPILKLNDKDLDELRKVINLIKSVFRGKVNRNCGTHIHISFNTKQEITEDLCRHFARSYRNNERDVFDKFVSANRRGTKCKWCSETGVVYYKNRYQKLNFLNVKLNNPNGEFHLEFRQLDGTLNYRRLVSWINLQKMFLELAMDSFNPKHTDVKDQAKDAITMNIPDIIVSDVFKIEDTEDVLYNCNMIY